MNVLKPTKENITQQDLIDAMTTASSSIKPYLLAKRDYYNLSEETKNKLKKLVDSYQFIN